MEKEGLKFDDNKLRWDLLPYDCVEEIVKVLSYGAMKYNEHPDEQNWKLLKDPNHRYFAALMRHLVAFKKGELIDKESGISHLAHAGANILFLIYFNKVNIDDNEQEL
jgi:hypothetical protein